MNVGECIRNAEKLLPGVPAPDGAEDPRWQAIIDVAEFIESEPIQVWEFAKRWGSSDQEDLRSAIATCLLEHLLEHHFELLFPKVEAATVGNGNLVETLRMCWTFGEAAVPANALKLEQLLQRSVRAS